MTPALGFEPHVHFFGPVDTIVGPEMAEHLIAALRELLSNVIRHARASRVEIRLHAGMEVILTVVDDGGGLPEHHRAGLGLANLTERARSLGGSFTEEAAMPHGVRAIWSIPRETRP